MPRISHVLWEGLDYGYVYDIQSSIELVEYWLEGRKAQIEKGFANYMASAKGKGHPYTPDAVILWSIIQGSPHFTDSTVAGVYATMQSKIQQQMAEELARSGRIFINTHGGYFSQNKKMALDIHDTHEIDTWTLPGAKVSISQWPDGEHFYARVGNQDVTLYGRNKWDTRQEAEDAAETWAKQKGVRL